MTDEAAGYDAAADTFVAARSATGRDVVEDWARTLPRGVRVLDVGAGHGWPVTQTLAQAGLDVSAIEPSQRLAAAFRTRLPTVPLCPKPLQDSPLLEGRWGGVAMIGVVFLLGKAEQRAALRRVAAALVPGGRLLFSAPRQEATWTDVLTGRRSCSLGRQAYASVLAAERVRIAGDRTDEGGNYYFLGEASGP